MRLSFLLLILLLSKRRSIYTLNRSKQYLNSETISGIKYCCLRGVPGKSSNQTSQKKLQKRLQMIKSAIHSHTEVLTISSPIREAEGPENVGKWSL